MSKKIKEEHVYFVDFNPAKKGEFSSSHLAVVLKLNKDNKTALVVPLTSKESSDNPFKVSIGVIDSLPPRLKTQNSYAVIDHSRNVSFYRFQNIIEGEVQVSNLQFKLLSKLYADRALSLFNQTEQREYVSAQFINHVKKDIMNFSYDIKQSLAEKIQIDPSYIKLYSDKFRLLELISLETIDELKVNPVVSEILEHIEFTSNVHKDLVEQKLENLSIEENDDSI